MTFLNHWNTGGDYHLDWSIPRTLLSFYTNVYIQIHLKFLIYTWLRIHLAEQTIKQSRCLTGTNVRLEWHSHSTRLSIKLYRQLKSTFEIRTLEFAIENPKLIPHHHLIINLLSMNMYLVVLWGEGGCRDNKLHEINL